MKNKLLLMIAVILLILSSALVASLNSNIIINLEYGDNINYDTDQDGVESSSNAIDFTVKNTLFDISINESKICTEWEILLVEENKKTNTCYGDDSCCSFIGLNSERENWNDDLYLNYGKYGASFNNKVSARIIYVDFSLDETSPYSNIYYSDYDYLYGVFIEETNLNTETKSGTLVFSSSEYSILSVPNSSNININITSPNNITPSSSGENIYLNFTTNMILNANYSLDGGMFLEIGNNTLFFSLSLNGILPYGVLKNGIHNITINLIENNSIVMEYNYSFEISDFLAPLINITHASSGINNSPLNSSDSSLEFLIVSDEYAVINYKLNNNPYNSSIDLGTDKNYSMNLSLSEGVNNLTINATDLQGNNRYLYYTFNFSYNPTCSDGKQNGDETGVDCGVSCSACQPFSVILVNSNYELGSTVIVQVNSRSNSSVNLSLLFAGNSIYNAAHNFYKDENGWVVAGWFPDLTNNIASAGKYTINATSDYMNNIESKLIYFNVTAAVTTLTITLNADDTTINEGETIAFTSSVQGSSGTLSYKWDFENDGTVDSTANAVNKTFSQNGTYTVNLIVTDSIDSVSTTKTITVKKIYNVTFTVKNESGNAVKNADIVFNDDKKNTSVGGITSFIVNPDIHELKVTHDGYLTYTNNSIDITQNRTIEIKLLKNNIEFDSPNITLIAPLNNQTLSENSVEITYIVNDNSAVNCSLHLSEYGSWWTEKETGEAAKNTENKFTLELDNGSYEYKIKCIDSYGNYEFSTVRQFTIDSQLAKESGYDEDIGSIIGGIDESKTEFEKLTKKEKEAYDTLEIDKLLDDSRKQLERIRRDLHNLRWRGVNDTERDLLEREMYDSIKNIKDKIPVKLKVVDSKEFVSYPNEHDVELITLEYLNYTEKRYSKKQIKNIIENNIELQSYLTVTTNSKIVDIEYLSENSEKITLIEKNLKIDGSFEEFSIIEQIPKEFAENTSDINALFEYEVILEDPIIKINLDESRKFAYYIKKEIKLDKIKKTKSILIDETYSPKTNSITGFGILDKFKPGFIKTSDTRLKIEILTIIILLVVYIGYSFKSSKIIYNILHIRLLKNMHKINKAVISGEENLKNDNYDKAKSLYKEAALCFKTIPKDAKKKVHKNLISLSGKIDMFYINKLVDDALTDIKNNDKEKAVLIYNQINEIYKKINSDFKSQVIQKCIELKGMLS